MHPKLKLFCRFENSTDDISGNGNHLNAYSNSFTDGNKGRGVDVFGTPYSANRNGSVSGIGNTQKMTISCYHRMNWHSNTSGDYQSTILYLWNTYRTYLAAYISKNDSYKTAIWCDQGIQSGGWYFTNIGSTVWNDGEAKHIIISVNTALSGTARTRLWLNGVAETMTQQSSSGTPSNWGNVTKIDFAGYQNVARYNAYMADELKVYNDLFIDDADAKRIYAGFEPLGR